jgi:arginase
VALSPRRVRRLNQVDPISAPAHLRLVWPQGRAPVPRAFARWLLSFPSISLSAATRLARRCSKRSCLSTMARPLMCPIEMGDIGLEERDGIEAKAVVLQQLRSALAIISEHEPARITTLGGECSVSMAPFSYLINRHGDDLVILWIDSHPDMGTGETAYPGFHAMVVSALIGHGDQELPRDTPGPPARHCSTGSATLAPRRWLSTLMSTRSTRTSSSWVCLGADRGGLTTAEARRVVADIDGAAEVVALTIAEFIPRQVMHLQQILTGFPLLGPSSPSTLRPTADP